MIAATSPAPRPITGRVDAALRALADGDPGWLVLAREVVAGFESAPLVGTRYPARMDPAGIPALKDAIHHMHGLDAEWVESVPVHETFEGETVWDGEVQVFEGGGCTVYAWSAEAGPGGRRRFHAVLRQGPVTGPAEAVRAAILADARADAHDASGG